MKCEIISHNKVTEFSQFLSFQTTLHSSEASEEKKCETMTSPVSFFATADEAAEGVNVEVERPTPTLRPVCLSDLSRLIGHVSASLPFKPRSIEEVEVDLGRDHGEWIIHQAEDMPLYPVSNEKQRYPGERIRCHIMFRELLDESEKDRMKENDARLDAIEWCMDICEERDRYAWDFNANMREDPDYPSPVRS